MSELVEKCRAGMINSFMTLWSSSPLKFFRYEVLPQQGVKTMFAFFTISRHFPRYHGPGRVGKEADATWLAAWNMEDDGRRWKMWLCSQGRSISPEPATRAPSPDLRAPGVAGFAGSLRPETGLAERWSALLEETWTKREDFLDISEHLREKMRKDEERRWKKIMEIKTTAQPTSNEQSSCLWWIWISNLMPCKKNLTRKVALQRKKQRHQQP